MVPMPIRTVPTDKTEYVRILGRDLTAYRKLWVGAVGIVAAYADAEKLVFVKIHNSEFVFNIEDVEYITKKEYFLGALGG